MAWGRFFGRWHQFKLNHEHSRLAQLAWMEALGLYWRHRTKLAALRHTRVSWPTLLTDLKCFGRHGGYNAEMCP